MWQYLAGLGIAALGIGFLMKKKPKAPNEPSIPAPNSQTPKNYDNSAAPIGDTFRTPKEYAIPHPSGLWQLGDRLVTILPLVDVRNGLYASMTYDDAKAWARANNARLISADEAEAIWTHGDRIDASRCQFVKTEADSKKVSTLAFAKAQKACIDAQLAERGIGKAGGKSVANAGKWWIDGAPGGRAWLMGWWNNAGVPIQPRPGVNSKGPHNSSYADYGTLTMVSFNGG